MKLIAINRPAGKPIQSIHAIELYPDSAPVLSGKPVFLPDWFKEYQAVIAPAYRIGRLGKSIKPKFASRYVDAVTLAARVYPVNSPVTPHIARPALAFAWDGSIVIGKWQEPPTDGILNIAAEASPEISLPLQPAEIDIDGMIADVSEIMTLKMGDIILPCYLQPALDLKPGDDIAYRLNSQSESLTLKIR